MKGPPAGVWGIELMRYYYLPVFIFKTKKRFKWRQWSLFLALSQSMSDCQETVEFQGKRVREWKSSRGLCLHCQAEGRRLIHTPVHVFHSQYPGFGSPHLLFCLWFSRAKFLWLPFLLLHFNHDCHFPSSNPNRKLLLPCWKTRGNCLRPSW